MAKQAKRGHSAPPVAGRSPTDELATLDSRLEAVPPADAIRADHVTPDLSQALVDRADLAGAELATADLRGATLRFAILSAADLGAADLSDANLQLARFDRANLSAAILDGAVLDHANLTGADLAKSRLRGATLRFATLQDARLNSADLSSADLRHARLDSADFSGANLRGAQLDYADFSGVKLSDADLSGAHLRYAKNLTQAQLAEGDVSEATILPLYLENSESAPWPTEPRGAAGIRPIWIAGAVVGVLAALGQAWQFLDPGDASPLLVEANARAAHAAPTQELVPAGDTIVLSEIRADAAPIAATPADLASPRAAVSVESLVAATSDAAPIAAPIPPVQIASRAGRADILNPSSQLDAVSGTKVWPYRLPVGPRRFAMLSDIPLPLLKAVAVTRKAVVRELEPEPPAMAADSAGAEPALASSLGFEPLTLVVSLREQKLGVYRGTSLVATSKISSGKHGYDTRVGVFSILEKRRHHHSNLYSGAPMPWMQRLTRTGTALHGGVVPGYPASHGCIRLPFSFAPKLFQMTTVGANVVVAGDWVAPKPIEHASLFQPMPARAEVALAGTGTNLFALGVSSVAAAAESPDRTGRRAEAGADTSAPLRILVTRRTKLDQIISTQYLLAALGYLAPQNFTGRLGQETLAAIRKFQKANGLPETGAFSDELATKVRQAAGSPEPPAGLLFVRQDFRPVIDVPINLREPQQSLGTHVFTMGLAPGSAKAAWTAVNLEGGESASVLDRIEIPDDVRRVISERLTPGSSLIVAETSVNSAILADGDDFLVLAKTAPAIAALEPPQGAKHGASKATRAKYGAAEAKPRIQGTRKRAVRRDFGPDLYGGFRLFRRW